MADERPLDDKLAPHDFVADFIWAARAVFHKPSVAVVSIAVWCLPPQLFLVALQKKNPLAGLVGLCVGLFALGWVGAERVFFRDRRDGKQVALRELLASVPSLIGPFLKLGFLVAIVGFPPMVVAVLLGSWLLSTGQSRLGWAVVQIGSIAVMVGVDLVLTFVPAALVFTTRSVREALRIGIRMIRQTWPRSGLYVLCPPLALNMLNAMYPTHLLVVTLLTTAGLAVLALLAKGATAAFYLRQRPLSAEVVARGASCDEAGAAQQLVEVGDARRLAP